MKSIVCDYIRYVAIVPTTYIWGETNVINGVTETEMLNKKVRAFHVIFKTGRVRNIHTFISHYLHFLTPAPISSVYKLVWSDWNCSAVITTNKWTARRNCITRNKGAGYDRKFESTSNQCQVANDFTNFTVHSTRCIRRAAKSITHAIYKPTALLPVHCNWGW